MVFANIATFLKGCFQKSFPQIYSVENIFRKEKFWNKLFMQTLSGKLERYMFKLVPK